MKSIDIRKITGIAGIAVYVLAMIVLPLYFIYSGPPPASNILTRALANMFATASLLIFITGFRQLIKEAALDNEWLGTLCFNFGFAFVMTVFVSDAIQVGSVLGKEGGVDPTTIGAGAEGAILLFGPIARLLTSAFLFLSSLAILRTKILPQWTALLGLVLALFHLALVPTIFSGTITSYFYSINGLGIPISGGLFTFWILIVSIYLVRKKNN
jgi:hypothetical protein